MRSATSARQTTIWPCAACNCWSLVTPFGRYAEQAQLELIYAHYNAYEHEAAVEAADRFIRLHPQHPNVDYAYYMKGLAAHTANEDIFSRFVPTDLTSRDMSHAREAFCRIFPTGDPLSRQPLRQPTPVHAWSTCAICWRGTRSMSRTTTSAVAPIWPPPTGDATWWRTSSVPPP